MTWLTRHAAWLLNPFLAHHDGLTSCPRRLQSTTNPALVEFAEKVHYTLHGKHNITKDDPSFLTGLWLGREPESGDHIVATRTTVVKTRSIRRYTYSERFDIELLQGPISVPWTLKGDGTFDPAFITDWDHNKGMPTSDQYNDDLNVPIRAQEEPPLPEGAVQPPPGLPRPQRQRPQRQPNLPPVPPPDDGAQHEEPHGAKRQRLHRIAVHHVALKNETLQVDVCVPEEDEIHIIADPIVHEELLNEYPRDKLQSAMNEDIAMMRDFDVATEVDHTS